ncbi:lipase member N isoform X1 [Daphnia magna]|uniref:lipase member N isoform X1 n=1 Tax=Daphnia magna TaxID=35525 RepID=UPI001E1BA205|nr:lipase member N isoform X1 [Daphnia magna]
MLFNRRLHCWLSFTTLVSTCCYTWSEHAASAEAITARKLLKNWSRKAEEDARLFDRLPQHDELFLTPPQVIRKRGYPVEIHHVTTADGYILELHRIPAKPLNDGSPRKAVFIHHGVIESSGTWLVNPSSLALPFLLADQSYDVWLGNFRGNRYSRRHVQLSPKQSKFWQFSWDEIGNFDIPAIINHILTLTGLPTMSYIGHSLGCGVFFIAMVKHPELNAKIDTMVALAPLSSFANFKTPIYRALAPFSRPIEAFLKKIGIWGWLDSDGLGDVLLKSACSPTYKQAKFCRYLLGLVTGHNRENIHPSIVALAVTNIFRGTSVQVIAQFGQNYLAGETFQAYDYGKKGNLKRYGSPEPYEYLLGKITAPVYVFSGGNDLLVTPEDVDWLLTQLTNLKGSVRIPEYSHMDFLWVFANLKFNLQLNLMLSFGRGLTSKKKSTIQS